MQIIANVKYSGVMTKCRLLGPELGSEGWGAGRLPSHLSPAQRLVWGRRGWHPPASAHSTTETCLLRASTKELIRISIHRVLSLAGSARKS